MLLIFISGSCGLCLYYRLLWPIIYLCSRLLYHYNSSHKPAGFFFLMELIHFHETSILIFPSQGLICVWYCELKGASNTPESDYIQFHGFQKQKPGTVSFCSFLVESNCFSVVPSETDNTGCPAQMTPGVFHFNGIPETLKQSCSAISRIPIFMFVHLGWITAAVPGVFWHTQDVFSC